jgi:signal transduction histidine kinase
MYSVRHSLRFKLALTFAAFGAMVSLLLSLGLQFAAHNQGERLMDETLSAEIDDYMNRRARNPNSLPPSTLSIRGYVLRQGEPIGGIPPELRHLDAGKHELTLAQIPYQILVVDKGGERYFMLFNEVRQQRREQTFLVYLMAGVLTMILISAGVGWWLAGHVVSPIAELSRRVSGAHPEDESLDVGAGFPADEIGLLAHVFGAYLKRMRAFIERERDFTADVSHELRTPLAIVQGVVEIMEDDGQLHGKQRERIARIGRANREMVNLTAALLLMSREQTAEEAVQQQCDVCEVVGESVEMHRHLLSADTRVDLHCDANPRIAAERTLLGVVVGNFIRNAFTFTKSGTVSVTVTGNSMTIADTGSGIRDEEIHKIFQRHFKGADSVGAGIGLSLVKRICDRYGWRATIESAEGRGTSVHLLFERSKPATP